MGFIYTGVSKRNRRLRLETFQDLAREIENLVRDISRIKLRKKESEKHK